MILRPTGIFLNVLSGFAQKSSEGFAKRYQNWKRNGESRSPLGVVVATCHRGKKEPKASLSNIAFVNDGDPVATAPGSDLVGFAGFMCKACAEACLSD